MRAIAALLGALVALSSFAIIVVAWRTVRINRVGGSRPALVRNAEVNSLEMARILEKLKENEFVWGIVPDEDQERINKVLSKYYRKA